MRKSQARPPTKEERARFTEMHRTSKHRILADHLQTVHFSWSTNPPWRSEEIAKQWEAANAAWVAEYTAAGYSFYGDKLGMLTKP